MELSPPSPWGYVAAKIADTVLEKCRYEDALAFRTAWSPGAGNPGGEAVMSFPKIRLLSYFCMCYGHRADA